MEYLCLLFLSHTGGLNRQPHGGLCPFPLPAAQRLQDSSFPDADHGLSPHGGGHPPVPAHEKPGAS